MNDSENRKVTAVYRFDQIESTLVNATSRQELFSDSNFQKQLFVAIDELMPDDGILSLDIFDTLLIRDNSSELTRFFEIGAKMAACVDHAATFSQVDAFLARYLGTKSTYRASKPVDGCREGSLTEIHMIASKILAKSDQYASAFIDEELKYESTRIEINGLLMDYINHHVKRGGRVVLVTDMYMHAEQVKKLLKLVGINLDLFAGLISSADTKVSKASGGIFRLVEDLLGAERNQFLHIGDSFHGDFKMPKARGWSALHLPVPRTEIAERQADHQRTTRMLHEKFSIHTDIALPH